MSWQIRTYAFSLPGFTSVVLLIFHQTTEVPLQTSTPVIRITSSDIIKFPLIFPAGSSHLVRENESCGCEPIAFTRFTQAAKINNQTASVVITSYPLLGFPCQNTNRIFHSSSFEPPQYIRGHSSVLTMLRLWLGSRSVPEFDVGGMFTGMVFCALQVPQKSSRSRSWRLGTNSVADERRTGTVVQPGGSGTGDRSPDRSHGRGRRTAGRTKPSSAEGTGVRPQRNDEGTAADARPDGRISPWRISRGGTDVCGDDGVARRTRRRIRQGRLRPRSRGFPRRRRGIRRTRWWTIR